jgi:TolB-like protein
MTTGMQYAAPPMNRKRNMILGAAAAAIVVAGGVVAWRLTGGDGSSTPGALGGLDPSSVAVLYFEDLSTDGSLGHVADGFTEGLIAQLAGVRGLDVVSRHGVAMYRDAGLTADSLARALNVGSIVTGTVEPVANNLRVTVRLVEGYSGADLSREGFQIGADQLLAAQDSVTENVARLLRQQLGEEVTLRERRAGTANVDAWRLLQQGERVRKRAEELAFESLDDALEAYENADSILRLAQGTDPDWIEPTVLRAEINYRRARLFDAHPDEAEPWIDFGLEVAEEGLGMESGHAGALEARGTLSYLKWLQGLVDSDDEADALFDAAQQDLESAIEAEPGRASAHAVLSHLYSQTGDLMLVAISSQRALQEDAFLSNADVLYYRLFLASYELDQAAQAERWCDEGRERFSDDVRFAECQLMLMTMNGIEPDIDWAWQMAEEWEALSAEPNREFNRHQAQMFVGGVLARGGYADSSRAVLLRARADRDLDERRELAWTEAFMRVLLGDHDEAIELLTEWMAANPGEIHGAEEEGYENWWWRDIRDDPRFRRVVGGG